MPPLQDQDLLVLIGRWRESQAGKGEYSEGSLLALARLIADRQHYITYREELNVRLDEDRLLVSDLTIALRESTDQFRIVNALNARIQLFREQIQAEMAKTQEKQ
jgi:hypothetical protein